MSHVFSPWGMANWLSTWGYLGVCICIFIGNLGVPLPEETVLLAAGFLAGRKALELSTLYLVGIASAVTADCFGFVFSFTGGQRLLEGLVKKFHFLRQRYDRLQTFFRAHGNKAVFLARFVVGARSMTGPIAGAAGMGFWRFLVWNLLAACLWCPMLITVAYFLGDKLDWLTRVAQSASCWIAVGLLVFAIIWFFWWHDRDRRRVGG
jgi:membrane protein DedA with SNARE-associated domain